MYIELLINNEVRRMYFGYMTGVKSYPNATSYFKYNYLNIDSTPHIVKYGTSFRQILKNDSPDTIKTTNNRTFATVTLAQVTDFRGAEIYIRPFSAPRNLEFYPTATASELKKQTQYFSYYYTLNLLNDAEANIRVGFTQSFLKDINTSLYARDFMLFATDEIIDGKRTIIALYDNKYTITDKTVGYCIGTATQSRFTQNGWLNLYYTITSPSFYYNAITRQENSSQIGTTSMFFVGTNKQTGGHYRRMLTESIPTAQYENYDYSNIIEISEANNTFFIYHILNETVSGKEYWHITRGSIQTSNELYNEILDYENPEPDTVLPDPIPNPDPEDPNDPDNPDNPDNLNPEPSDPIDKPIPSPSITFTAKLITAYEMTSDNLNSLANEMWTTSFYDNVVKMFQNPMDCLISLSEYPIDVGGTVNKSIVLGNVELETSGLVITNPFKVIDLGVVIVDEKFKSYLDYMNTAITIYLPFIGFEQISIDYMNSYLQLTYNVDILSGNCVAILHAISFNSNLKSVVGQWNGNMAYQIPLSGRDFSQMASSLWNTAMSAGSVIASSRIPAISGSGFSKGSPAGWGMPSLGSVSDLGNNIINTIEAANATTSGGHLSANAGHLGSMQPYLIISRPAQKINSWYYNSYGRILDSYASFSSLSGFTKVKSCNLTLPSATAEETQMIDKLLKEGVIF